VFSEVLFKIHILLSVVATFFYFFILQAQAKAAAANSEKAKQAEVQRNAPVQSLYFNMCLYVVLIHNNSVSHFLLKILLS